MELPSTAEEEPNNKVTIGEARFDKFLQVNRASDESGNIAAALTFDDIDMCSSTGGSLASVASIGVDRQVHGAFAINTPKADEEGYNMASLGVWHGERPGVQTRHRSFRLTRYDRRRFGIDGSCSREETRHFSMNPLGQTSDVGFASPATEPPRKPAYGSVICGLEPSKSVFRASRNESKTDPRAAVRSVKAPKRVIWL